MLVLSRKHAQSIEISGVGTITIISVQGDRVKIGLDIRNEFRVMRSELLSEFHEIDRQNPCSTILDPLSPKQASRYLLPATHNPASLDRLSPKQATPAALHR